MDTRGQDLLLASLKLSAVHHVGSLLAVSCKLHVACDVLQPWDGGQEVTITHTHTKPYAVNLPPTSDRSNTGSNTHKVAGP